MKSLDSEYINFLHMNLEARAKSYLQWEQEILPEGYTLMVYEVDDTYTYFKVNRTASDSQWRVHTPYFHDKCISKREYHLRFLNDLIDNDE